MSNKTKRDLINSYDDSQIEILEGLDHILKKPSMYLGGLETPQHTLEEAIMNSVDEFKVGVATRLDITLHKDKSISVQDDGRGIPPQYSEKFKMPTARGLLTVPNSGKGLVGASSQFSSQHGIGMKATVATADWVKVNIWRNGTEWTDSYALVKGKPGIPTTKLTKSGELPSGPAPKGSPDHGTRIQWLPNKEVFDSLDIKIKDLLPLIEAQSYLNGGMVFTVSLESKDKVYEFHNPGGLSDLIHKMANSADSNLITPVYQFTQSYDLGRPVRNEDGELVPLVASARIAFAWINSTTHQAMLYTNNVPNPLGGTPVSGASAGIAKLINNYAKDLGLSKETLEQRDILPGLIMIIDLTLPNPQFDGQTKKKVLNKDAVAALTKMVTTGAPLLFDRNIEPIRDVIKMAIKRAAARKKAEDEKINVKKSDAQKALSRKLEPCRKLGAGKGSELIIVEGDSAGGDVTDERDPDTQAVLPVRGKTLNAWKASHSKVMSNEELLTLFSALGTGVGREFNLSKRNYDKIIIAADQDPDGSHIACLIISAILRYAPDLIVGGHVYRVLTPLFVNEFKGNAAPVYTYSNREQEAFLKTAKGKKVYKTKRNKGLGEVGGDMIRETVIDRAKRKLVRYQLKDEVMGDAIDLVDDFMGGDAAARKAIFFNPDIYELVDAEVEI